MSAPISRREFLKITSIGGTALLISLYLPGCENIGKGAPSPTPTTELTPTPTGLPGADEVKPSIWVRIDRNNLVTITIHRTELGQGVRTALAMILTEELDADWRQVRVEQAGPNFAYGDQNTGGSTSIQSSYLGLRLAGATARLLFINSAAQIWNCPSDNCMTENGEVVNKTTNERLSYGHLVPVAATLPVPGSPTLKKPEEFQIIGKRIARIDTPDLVTGKAVFGTDVRVPGMLFAVVAHCPILGGIVAGYDDTAARAVPGVIKVVQIDSGVGVLARDTWSAIRGRQALSITWQEGDNAAFNSDDLEQQLMQQAMQNAPAEGLTCYYTIPYFAHVPMETMNCTASLHDNQAEVWVPTQSPGGLPSLIAANGEVSPSAVTVHVPLVGGGFGRRLESGLSGVWQGYYLTEAVELSKAAGAPVQLLWTREDDLSCDLFHPLSVSRISADLKDISTLSMVREEATSGAPTGYWRAVGNVADAFAHESFMDEFAAATHQDPIELHRQVLGDREQAVLELAAQKSSWGSPLPPGEGRGIALHASWGVSPCAQVVEVKIDSRGNVQVQRVVCAIDCGTPINPDMIEAQMESGIIFGLSAALKRPITIQNGHVQQSNFSDYPILTIAETPKIEVYIVPSTDDPTGIGEMSNPVTMPALANAICAATGKRIRRLPIRTEDLQAG
jgi:isoquinoline 1-oxidoreductase beta subunit